MSSNVMRFGLPDGVQPYDWALDQLNVQKAHAVSKGSRNVIVAVIDLGYTHHPDLDGHLWENPKPVKGDVLGWDCADDDASLEYTGTFMSNHNYYHGHHVFIAGEVAAVAPHSPIMIVRVGYSNAGSWAEGIRYAVNHGAKILVMPHQYLTGGYATGSALFVQGTDFTYPVDNPELRGAFDYACDNGCIIFSSGADNRGRRVAFFPAAHDASFIVGSTNRNDEAADICGSCDYTHSGTPGGDRQSDNEDDQIWGCGPDQNYIPFTGGCMASGFAGGVAALIWSRFPDLTPAQLRQVLRNTARAAKGLKPNDDGWEPKLGYGIVDAAKAVALRTEQLCRNVRVNPSSVKLLNNDGRFALSVTLENLGAFDAEKAITVAYNGNPANPVVPDATQENPAPLLQTKQIGHTIARVRGLWQRDVTIELVDQPAGYIYFETFCADAHDIGHLHRCKVPIENN